MASATHHVLLVRHGRTAFNAEGRLRGLADPELDPVGIDEARRTTNSLRSLGIARVISSPLRRAVASARIIADGCGVNHTVDPAFNDRDYGRWTGHLKTDVIAQWGTVDDAPGVEPQASVLARALDGLNALTFESDAAPLAIVTHDAVIRPILASIEPGTHAHVHTASWAELVGTEQGWTIASVDNTAM